MPSWRGGKVEPTPDFRREVLQSHIRWDLEHDVGDKEDREGDVVLVTSHVQVVLKAGEPGIANVAPDKVLATYYSIFDGHVGLNLPIEVRE